MVSHALPKNPCSSPSLWSLCSAGMLHPACFPLQWPELYCCLPPGPACLTVLGLNWACLAIVLTCFFPHCRWSRSSCRRSVSSWGQASQKRCRNLLFLPSGVPTIIMASKERLVLASFLTQFLQQGESQLLFQLDPCPFWLWGGFSLGVNLCTKVRDCAFSGAVLLVP